MRDTPRTEVYVLDPLPQVVSADWARQLERELNAAKARVAELENCIESAWGIIANASGGNWNEQHPEWQEAARKWRDDMVFLQDTRVRREMGGAR